MARAVKFFVELQMVWVIAMIIVKFPSILLSLFLNLLLLLWHLLFFSSAYFAFIAIVIVPAVNCTL